MARPKNIPKEISTQYFQGVTPLWMLPGEDSIPKKYNDAVMSLAEWCGPEWHVNGSSNFLLMRNVLIKSCGAWSQYDWESDEARIDQRRNDAKHRPTLARAAKGLKQALSKAPFNRKKRQLALSFLYELRAEAPESTTIAEGIAAVERVIERFADQCSRPDHAAARFGPIEYSRLPKTLPRREVAIALSLAGKVTLMRRDGLQAGSKIRGGPPNISDNLPWKAIAEFASANCEDANDIVDASSVQTLVMSLSKKISRVY
jgi:hypothetical protein